MAVVQVPEREVPDDRRPQRRTFEHWTITLALGALTGGLLVLFLLDGQERHLVSAVAMGVTTVPFALASLTHPGELVRPLPLIGLGLFLGVGGQVVYLTYVADEASARDALYQVPRSQITLAVLALAVGVIALAFGYVAAGHTRSRSVLVAIHRATRMGETQVWRVEVLLWVCAALSLYGQVRFLQATGVDTLAELLDDPSGKRRGVVSDQVAAFGYLRMLISVAGLAFLIGWYTLLAGGHSLRSRLGLGVLTCFTLAVVFGLVSSSRAEVFTVSLSALLIWVFVRRHQPRTLTILLGLVLAVVVIIGMLGLRGESQHKYDSATDIVRRETVAASVFASGDWFSVAKTAPVVNRVPESQPFLNGRTLTTWVVAPIPKSMWPDKPSVRVGQQIGPSVFRLPSSRVSGVPPGLVGELYLNFSWPGIVIGMALFGAVVRRLDALYDRPLAVGCLPALLFAVLTVELALRLPKGDVTGVFIPLLQTTVILTVMMALVRPRRRPRRIAV